MKKSRGQTLATGGKIFYAILLEKVLVWNCYFH